jgi:hypothetical protein
MLRRPAAAAALVRLDSIAALRLATYDGSGQVVHPDIQVFQRPWRGSRFWLVVTPYPSGDPAHENPEIYASRDGLTWSVPAGAKNPVVARPAVGHNSDADLLYDPTRDELRLYYRATTDEADSLFLVTSRDGRRWTPRGPVLAGAKATLLAPAVVRSRSRDWRMWTVDGSSAGCRSQESRVEMRRSADGRTWGRPAPVTLAQPGYVVWHVDADYVPARREYWMLYAAYPVGANCATSDLFLARSRDGLTWVSPAEPVLRRGAVPLFAENVYRSTFAYDAIRDLVTIWYSGTGSGAYRAAVARYRAADLLKRLNSPAPRRVVAGAATTN